MSPELPAAHEKSPSNHVPLQGQPNFRDLGGLKTADGRTVKPGLIYRSGELSRLSDQDITTLQELGIKTVVDFRSEEEVEWNGEDRLPAGANYVALRLQPGNLGPVLYSAVATGDASLLPDNVLADANRANIREATAQMSGLFNALSDPANLPLVLHCTHGKDRTGVASAVVLMALGVPPELAKKDYLQSNDYRQEENEELMAELSGTIVANQGAASSPEDLAKFKALLYLEPSFFEAILDEIEKQYGSLESYLEDSLGIGAAQVKDLRDRLTE